MIVLYPFYALTSLLFTGLTYVLAPLLACLADSAGNLPKQLSWFQTFDAPLPPGRWSGVKWLWRNPGYTFDLLVLGIEWDPDDWVVHAPGPKVFFATSRRGAFNVCLQFPCLQLKLGWKAWNHWEGDHWVPGNWSGFSNIPLCCTLSR